MVQELMNPNAEKNKLNEIKIKWKLIFQLESAPFAISLRSLYLEARTQNVWWAVCHGDQAAACEPINFITIVLPPL